jgi:sugar/nucleoside kinase (ribokinase family)
MDCFFLGGSSVDTILELPRMPQPDEKMLARFAGVQAGGLVANAACAAARLGLVTGWAGVLGDDAGGKLALKDLQGYGVDTRWVEVLPDTISDFCIILLDPSRERSILVANTTANMPAFGPDLLAALAAARVVYLIPQPRAVFERLHAAVHAGGGKMAIDLEAAHALPREEILYCLAHSEIIFCNASALSKFSGQAGTADGARVLLEMGAEVVVVTMGARGAAAFRAGEEGFAPSFPVAVVDTTGAGDCFHGAFLAGWLSGWSLRKCLIFSNAAAALSVREIGARGSLPDQADVRAFLAAQADGNIDIFQLEP